MHFERVQACVCKYHFFKLRDVYVLSITRLYFRMTFSVKQIFLFHKDFFENIEANY